MEELKENIRKNWNDYDVDNDIDKYIASILAIIVVEDLDKKIFTYELKSEKIIQKYSLIYFNFNYFFYKVHTLNGHGPKQMLTF